MKDNKKQLVLSETLSLTYYGSIDEPFFTIKDICKTFEIDRYSRLIVKILKNKDFTSNTAEGSIVLNSRNNELKTINEYGLYEVIYRSDKEICKNLRFKFSKLLHDLRVGNKTIISKENEQLKLTNQQSKEETKEHKKTIFVNKKFFNKTKPVYQAKLVGTNFNITFQTSRNPLIRLRERLIEIKRKGNEVTYDVTMFEINELLNENN